MNKSGNQSLGSNMKTDGSSSASSAAGSSSQLVQEYVVRVPKLQNKPYSVMRFNGPLNIDFTKWSSAKMNREDNSKIHKSTFPEDNMPKFGAGSEYGREAREEARRKKYGFVKRKYNIDDQPWILKTTDKEKTAKKFKGIREGGVSENASYFVFTQAPDGAFDVFPVKQWYNFSPVQTYKPLSAEEAEEEFGRRNKIMNYFSVMVKKRMKNEMDDDEDKPKKGSKPARKKRTGDLKVSEMDDWDSDKESEDDEEDENGATDKKKPKKKAPPKKKKKKDSDSEAGEDSDDGDDEGRELDYISDSSESEESEVEKERLTGVEEEKGLLNLLESGSSSESESEKKEEDKEEEEKEEKSKPKDKKKKKTKPSDSESEPEDLDQLDSIEVKQIEVDQGETKPLSVAQPTTEEPSTSAASNKRKAEPTVSSPAPTKKPKLEMNSALMQAAAAEGITEEAVRRYLLRKPMTVTELLQKFKSKKTRISSQDMVNVIATILKTINPTKRTQNNKMYLFLKN